MRNLKLMGLAVILTVSTALSAQAATVTWTGLGDGTTWGDAANWTGGAGAPAANDDVVINTNVSSINVAANTAIINSLTITANVTSPIALTGTNIIFANNGNFTVASGAGQLTLGVRVAMPNTANASATFTNNSSNPVLLNTSNALVGGTATAANRTWNLAGAGGFQKTTTGILVGGSNNGAANLNVASGTILNLSGGTSDDALGDGSGSPMGGLSGGGTVTNTASGTAKNVQLRWQNSNFTGSLQGNILLAVQGNTHTFSGANTYSSTTSVTSGSLTVGTLVVNGTHVGGDNYTVAGSSTGTAILAGTGSVVLVNNTKTISAVGFNATNRAIVYPGASNTDTADLDLGTDGATSVLTSVRLDDFTTLRLDIGTTSNSDRLDIFGNFGLNGTDGLGAADVRLELMGLGASHGTSNFDGSTFTLATWTGTLAGIFDSIWVRDTATGTLQDVTSAITGSGYVVGANTYTLQYLSNSLVVSAIPEPSTYAMVGLGLGALWILRRRNKKA